ncbi:hypothetical protein [Flavobacterium sp.]|uniref:hypothetical protein n=1 Tax=Flavobacterium sp. TaxID=239 RepID=UPI00286B3D20|nr:hypothetical protein [Flavobacterium sp.]
MKKFTYSLAIITLFVTSSFLTSCTVEDILDDSKNEITVQVNQVDPPVVPPRSVN